MSEKRIHFSDEITAMDAVKQIIPQRIRSGGRGAVFTPKDFLDVASRYATDQALKTVIRTKDKHQLVKDARYTTDWIADVVRQIAGRAGKPGTASHG